MLYVIGYKDLKDVKEGSILINTTSRSNDFGRGLSPFLVNGGYLYYNYSSKNVENAWQFAKVYKEFVDEDNNPTDRYFEWAKKGWEDSFAHRYPMGKGEKPLYSYWNGKKLGYIEARKQIYIPIYARNVIQTSAFKMLKDLYLNEKKDIYLLDFDGYNHIKLNISNSKVINDPSKTMGHAFVLYFLLNKIKKNE